MPDHGHDGQVAHRSHSSNRVQELTRAVWGPRADGELNPEDVRQITQNVVGFFGILAEWAARENQATHERES